MAFGGRVVITLKNGTVIEDELAVADAHIHGARPFGREQYIHKFRTLAEGIVDEQEIERFLGLVQRLPELSANEMAGLTVTARAGYLDSVVEPKGLF